jgi:glycine betaine/proline transport system ATP-binding protein
MTKTELNDKHNHVLGLKDINIEMPGGGIQVVMGLSGSGKSTLIRHINRLIDPTAGEVIVGDEDVVKMNEIGTARVPSPQDRYGVSEVRASAAPHGAREFGLRPGNPGGTSREEQENQARRWISRVGLDGFEDNYPNQLSGGMQQRVGLARALTNDAPILLMDEAFSALDPLIRMDMQSVLAGSAEGNPQDRGLHHPRP